MTSRQWPVSFALIHSSLPVDSGSTVVDDESRVVDDTQGSFQSSRPRNTRAY